jgi:hypothetical protein
VGAADVARAVSTKLKSYVGSVRARDERKKNASRRSISYAVMKRSVTACDRRVPSR